MLSDAAARASFLRVFIPDVAIASSTPLEPKGPPQFPGQKEAADFVDHFRGPPNAHIVVDLTTREQDIIGTNLLRRLAATGTSASPQFSVPYVPFYGASMDFSCRTQAGEHVIVEVSTVGRGALLRAAAKYGEQDVAGEITRVVVVNIQDARMRLGALEPSASTANEKKNKNWKQHYVLRDKLSLADRPVDLPCAIELMQYNVADADVDDSGSSAELRDWMR